MLRFECGLLLTMLIWMAFLSGCRKAFLWLMLCYAVIAGAAVHPVAYGLSPLYDKRIAETIREIDERRPGVWWSNDRVVAQLPLAMGLRCWAGTQQYCDEKFWKVIDPARKWESVWNRYAHRFCVSLGGKHVLENRGRPDCIYYDISHAQLKELHVNYVIWRGGQLNDPGLKLLGRVGPDAIYEVQYH